MKAVLFSSVLCISIAFHCQAQQQSATDHAAGVDGRGDHAMGFSHEATTHHFTLLRDGGTIEVDTKAAHDDASLAEIRTHLAHIASMFRSNNFDTPMFIHDTVPPGVPVMKQKQSSISYTFHPTAHGGQVRIKSHDPAAIEAIHEFLKFQITDHRTGDSGRVM